MHFNFVARYSLYCFKRPVAMYINGYSYNYANDPALTGATFPCKANKDSVKTKLTN